MRKYCLLVLMLMCSNSVFAESSKITIKDFYLGMATQEVSTLIKRLNLSARPAYNKCTTKKDKFRVKPLSAFQDQRHLHDQECYFFPYDLLGSGVEVKAAFHDNKLFWVTFEGYGSGSSIGDNIALIQALKRKYGEPSYYNYQDVFGQSKGMKWAIGDARIKLRSNALLFHSSKGSKEMQRREKLKNDKIGSAL